MNVAVKPDSQAKVDTSAYRFLHTMIRVRDLNKSLRFYTELLGMQVIRQKDYESGRFTLAFVGYGDESAGTVIELTHNWDTEDYAGGRNFGHLAYQVDDIYALCQRLQDKGVTINRPPRDGHMAFVRSPDGISIELLQKGGSLAPQEPWSSMPNVGVW